MNRRIIGIAVVSILAAAVIFGTVGSLMEVIEATSAGPTPQEVEYVGRLTAADDGNPALLALKYACPFH